MDTRPIGVFDSGVGGLTVAAEIIKALPNEKIIYFGDTARLPYGTKSKEAVTRFSKQIVKFLMSFDVKAIVIACNTISSNSYDDLQKEFDIKFIEVITPGAESCAKETKNKIVGITGTQATIESHAYEKKLTELMPGIKVHGMACGLFVPLAEEGWTDCEIAYLTAKEYLDPMIEKGIDSIVLGCTHYPLLYNCIKRAAGDNIKIINPAYATALKLKEYLTSKDMLNPNEEIKEPDFYLSDQTPKFKEICKIALGREYEANKADIECL